MEMRNRSAADSYGYRFVAAVYPLFHHQMICQQSCRGIVEGIVRVAMTCSFVLFFLIPGAFGQGPQDAHQQTAESEYRKFDERLSSLRTRNAQLYAISS